MTYTYQDALWDCLTVAGAVDDGRRGPGSLPTAADKEQFARRVVTEVAMLRSRWAEAIECMDELEADIEALSADMTPETKSLRDMTRRQLRLYARRGRRKLRDAHMRTAELAAQRDAAQAVIRRYKAGWHIMGDVTGDWWAHPQQDERSSGDLVTVAEVDAIRDALLDVPDQPNPTVTGQPEPCPTDYIEDGDDFDVELERQLARRDDRRLCSRSFASHPENHVTDIGVDGWGRCVGCGETVNTSGDRIPEHQAHGTGT